MRLIHKNFNGTFQDLLKIENDFTIHERNLQKLAIEMYKVKNHLSPTLIQGLFSDHSNSYDLRNERCWTTNNINTDKYGKETFLFRGPKTWEILPSYIKDSPSLNEFKAKIKLWKPVGCTCRLCKIFIPNLGYL